MNRPKGRDKACTVTDAKARLDDARRFLQAAELLTEPGNGDVIATNAIHSAIASADTLCCLALGRRSNDSNHRAAVQLLHEVDPRLANQLRRAPRRRPSTLCPSRGTEPTTPADSTLGGRRAVVTIDITTEIVINRPVAQVAAYAAEPSNAPSWYVNIKSAESKTAPPLQVGSLVAFVAQFMGKRLEYTYEVVAYVPGERLQMTTAQGPFPMATTYTWEPAGELATRMTLRNHGRPAGFSKPVAPLMKPAIRRANTKDLQALKQLLERST